MGPVMGTDISGANHIVQNMLRGAMPGFPDLWIPIVDVRDVASAHILAMTTPGAAGERFLLSSGPVTAMREIGAALKSALGDDADKVPTRSIPDADIRTAAESSPAFGAIVPDLGYQKRMSSEKAHRVLGWAPRPSADAIVAAGQSMVRAGLASS